MPARKALRASSAIALTAALLGAGAPSVNATEPTTTARAMKVRCANPDGDGRNIAAHRFRLPKRQWEIQTRDRSCKAKRGRLTVQVVWRKGAGSRDGMARYLEETAASKPGFHLKDFDTNSAKFKAPMRHTRKYDFTYRGENGRRRVIAFGDRFTLLRISAPKSRSGAAKKAIRKARKTMVRRFTS